MAECDSFVSFQAEKFGVVDPSIYEFDADKRRAQLFDECMKSKGYTK
jgi:hypothetical protein